MRFFLMVGMFGLVVLASFGLAFNPFFGPEDLFRGTPPSWAVSRTPTPTPFPPFKPFPTATATPDRNSNAWVRGLIEEIHRLVNVERSQANISALDYDVRLEAVARLHSIDMGRNNYFAHDTLEGLSPTDRAVDLGYDCRKDFGSYYVEGIGENIHQGWLYSAYRVKNGVSVGEDYLSVKALARLIVEGWMDSPGHRDNILTASYDRQGLGVFVTPNEKVYTTQNFC